MGPIGSPKGSPELYHLIALIRDPDKFAAALDELNQHRANVDAYFETVKADWEASRAERDAEHQRSIDARESEIHGHREALVAMEAQIKAEAGLLQQAKDSLAAHESRKSGLDAREADLDTREQQLSDAQAEMAKASEALNTERLSLAERRESLKQFAETLEG